MKRESISTFIHIYFLFQPCESKSETLSNRAPVEYTPENYKMSPRMMNQMVKYAKYAKSITVKAPESGVTSVKLTAVYKGKLCDDEERSVTLTQNGQSHYLPKTNRIYWSSTLGYMDIR